MKRMTLSQAANVLHCQWLGEDGELPMRFRIDSREVAYGDAFVALPGDNTDGHRFIGSALENGASLILMNKAHRENWEKRLLDKKIACLFADEPLYAMAALAKAHLSAVAPKVIGITGSVGKTTTREFAAAILSAERRVHSAKKSYNTLIGCSLTILEMPADTEVLIMELGTNHPGEIAEIVEQFPVTHGAITEVAATHLEGLGSVEGVLSAKMEITQSSKIQFLSYNFDNVILREKIKELPSKIERTGVGYAGGEIVVRAAEQSLAADGKATLDVEFEYKDMLAKTRAAIFGIQHARNIGYAISLCVAMGVDFEKCAETASASNLLPGRGALSVTASGSLLLDESYNASPVAVIAALKNIHGSKLPHNYKKIAILGGMRELGEETSYWHAQVLQEAKAFDETYLIGSEWNEVCGDIRCFATCDEFTRYLSSIDFSNAIILLKGSRYYALEHLLPEILKR